MGLPSFALAVAFLACGSNGDWIDPDTPMDQRLTQPYTVIPKKPGGGNSNDKPSKTKHRRRSPTDQPSPAPTTTPQPSQTPSSTPTSYPTATPNTFELVFSDEFNTPGRTFEDGADPRWTAMEKNDYTNSALHYYSTQNAATNEHGELVITTEATDVDVIGYDDVKQKKTRIKKHFKSAMLQSWNKFCFTGGIIETEVTLPGKPDVGGLWPAFWLLGNLARHTYVGSSQHVWPWSATRCTEKSFQSQLFSGCDKVAHYGMKAQLGRGAPEIDIFEVQPGPLKANEGVYLESPVGQPFMSSSFQVAPGKSSNRPGNGYWPGPGQWYEGLKGGNKSALNIQFYGNYNHFAQNKGPKLDYWSDAISYNRQLEATHFNSSHIYRLEWDVPTDDKDGYLHWFVDGELVVSINGTGLKKSGVGSEIASEPVSVILNTAVSSEWGFPKPCPTNCPCKDYDCNSKEWQYRCGFSSGFCDMMKTSPEYKVNWVRVYQDPNKDEQKVGCSTPERPTRKYIESHEDQYKTSRDDHPLKPIQRGLGVCVVGAEGEAAGACGGPMRGTCTRSSCQCQQGWTGPNCLSREGSDPIPYDLPDKIADIGFVAIDATPFRGLIFIFAVLVFMLVATMASRKRFDGWSPIPEADYKMLDTINEVDEE